MLLVNGLVLFLHDWVWERGDLLLIYNVLRIAYQMVINYVFPDMLQSYHKARIPSVPLVY